jgi:hypothetical protein
MNVRLPLRQRIVEGYNCNFPIVRLRVRDQYGAFAELDFRIDTQANFTCIPVTRAQVEHIPFSRDAERRVGGLVGETTTYRNQIRILIAGREHDWPCDIILAPVARDSAGSFHEPMAVLGRAGFLDAYAISIDSNFLIITRIGPLRRWLRKCLHNFWEWFGLVHPNDKVI